MLKKLKIQLYKIQSLNEEDIIIKTITTKGDQVKIQDYLNLVVKVYFQAI